MCNEWYFQWEANENVMNKTSANEISFVSCVYRTSARLNLRQNAPRRWNYSSPWKSSYTFICIRTFAVVFVLCEARRFLSLISCNYSQRSCAQSEFCGCFWNILCVVFWDKDRSVRVPRTKKLQKNGLHSPALFPFASCRHQDALDGWMLPRRTTVSEMHVK